MRATAPPANTRTPPCVSTHTRRPRSRLRAAALPPAHRAAADALVARLASLPGAGAAAAHTFGADGEALTTALQHLGDLLGSDDAVAAALAAARSQPSLLLLRRDVLADRLIALRTALPPTADAAAIARLGPWLLLEADPGEVARGAIARMASLMPGVGPDALCGRLAAGGTTWLSFSDVAQSLVRARRAREG